MRRWLASPGQIVLATVALAVTVWAVGVVATARTRPLEHQPGPDAIEYADGAWQLGHGHGYFTFWNEGVAAFGHRAFPPRYPFGTSAALAPFAAFSSTFPGLIQIGSKVITILYVLALVLAAWRLGGPLAGGLAALMVGLSPFAQTSAQIILSDALASLVAVLILIALTFPRHLAAMLAGAAAGAAVCVRLLAVVLLVPLPLVLRGRRRLAAAAGAIPLVGALAWYQWHAFGAPWRTGYGYWAPTLRTFAFSFLYGHTPGAEGPYVYPDKLHGALMSWTCPCHLGGPMATIPNWAFYPSVVIGLFWVFLPPFTGLLGLGELIRRRASAPAVFTLVALVLNIVLVDFYYDKAARFVAPTASLLLVYSAVGGAGLLSRLVRLREVRWRKPGLRPRVETSTR